MSAMTHTATLVQEARRTQEESMSSPSASRRSPGSSICVNAIVGRLRLRVRGHQDVRGG